MPDGYCQRTVLGHCHCINCSMHKTSWRVQIILSCSGGEEKGGGGGRKGGGRTGGGNERRRGGISHSLCHLPLWCSAYEGRAWEGLYSAGARNTQSIIIPCLLPVISKVRKDLSTFQQISYEYQVKPFQVNHTKLYFLSKTGLIIFEINWRLKVLMAKTLWNFVLISFWVIS